MWSQCSAEPRVLSVRQIRDLVLRHSLSARLEFRAPTNGQTGQAADLIVLEYETLAARHLCLSLLGECLWRCCSPAQRASSCVIEAWHTAQAPDFACAAGEALRSPPGTLPVPMSHLGTLSCKADCEQCSLSRRVSHKAEWLCGAGVPARAQRPQMLAAQRQRHGS